MNIYEEFVLKKIKEVQPNAEEQDLHTGKFTLGGAWVAEILEDYEKQLHKQKASDKPSNCILADVSKRQFISDILEELDGKHQEYHYDIVKNFLDAGC